MSEENYKHPGICSQVYPDVPNAEKSNDDQDLQHLQEITDSILVMMGFDMCFDVQRETWHPLETSKQCQSGGRDMYRLRLFCRICTEHMASTCHEHEHDGNQVVQSK